MLKTSWWPLTWCRDVTVTSSSVGVVSGVSRCSSVGLWLLNTVSSLQCVHSLQHGRSRLVSGVSLGGGASLSVVVAMITSDDGKWLSDLVKYPVVVVVVYLLSSCDLLFYLIGSDFHWEQEAVWSQWSCYPGSPGSAPHTLIYSAAFPSWTNCFLWSWKPFVWAADPTSHFNHIFIFQTFIIAKVKSKNLFDVLV